MDPTDDPHTVPASHVVCVGSSAGGLEALRGMVGALPRTAPFCYVIAQHASAAQDNPLPALLARATELPVRAAHDGAPLVAATILVIPAGADARVDESAIRLSERTAPGPGPTPSIDLLLTSAASTWGSAAIGVVLSGTGDDGAAGVRAISAAGGTTVVQEPATAGFPQMPEASIVTEAVDLVLPVDAIGPGLERRLSPAAHRAPGEADGSGADRRGPGRGPVAEQRRRGEPFDDILATILAETGTDFTGYKQATLRRQIERRMAVRQVTDIGSYRDVVVADGQEARALAAALLITVTSFFRDPQVWQALRVPLAAAFARDRRGPVRVWVPGCATGPEAYSLGMVVGDLLGEPASLARRLKIFATDLNEDALQVARRGRYTDDAVQAIPEDVRERWASRVDGGWEMAAELRDCVVFARHDIAHDPPFHRIDLVSLRNTLIYFESALQERVLRLLHFSLVPDGLLLLGESERVIDTHDLFETLNAKDRIYRRRATATAGILPTPQLRPTEVASRGRDARRDDREVLRDALIGRFVPPSLVLNADDEVIEVVGDVARWCRVAEGRHSSHVVALVREEFRTVVRTLVLRVRQTGAGDAERSVSANGADVVISVRPLARGNGSLDDPVTSGRLVVAFVSPPAGPALSPPAQLAREPAGRPDDPGVARMLRELESTEAALQATIEQLSTSNEELQALNEELQAAGEELQASNEEVRASNEELEATNEELSSLNSELQQRSNDLATANTDLENIQASLTSGLVLVDRELRIMRYTPLAVRLFALIDTDLGRQLTVIPSTIDIPDLEARLRAAVDQQRDDLVELHGDKSAMLLHVHPYRGAAGEVRGAIVVCTDISEVASAHRVAQQRLRDLVAVTEALRETVWQRADDGRLLFLTSQVESLYGLSRGRVLDDPGLLLTAVHPEDRARVALASAAVAGEPYELEYRIVRPDGRIRWVHESVVPVPPDDIGPGYSVSSAADVTEQREGRERAAEQLATLEAVFDNSVFGILILDAHHRVLRVNDVFVQISGFDRSAAVGMPVHAVATDATDLVLSSAGGAGDPDVREHPAAGPGSPEVLGTGIVQRRLLTRDGRPYFVTMEVRPLALGGAARHVVIVHDVTRLREATARLVSQARFDEQTGLLARAHFNELLATELGRADRAKGRVAVLWIDLDGFKQVNDQQGHRAGDAALREVAARLQRLVRRHDAVGRLGGDEFAMLITDIDRVDGLEAITDRVLSALREPIQLRDTQIYLSGSVGVAVAPDDGRDPDSLLHSADTAMYASKQSGGDRRTYFQPDMNQVAEERAGIRQDLAAALRRRQFVVHYQPIVDVRSGRVSSVEALIRWVRDGEVTAAAEFMAVAERTGQLRAVGAIALDLVDRDLHVLRADPCGRALPVCLNLSPTQLEERDVLDRLLAWDPAGGFENLVVEVTEAAALARGGRAADALAILVRLGARLSIDDFGTGYSNLALLDRLRPTLIKIDRSLLLGAVDQPRGEAVLRAAAQLAHALDAEVVVEGVEDDRLRDLAESVGADHLQGYRIARPMPLDALLEWVRDHPPGSPRPVPS